jgi:tRNA(adenine34) deaminase
MNRDIEFMREALAEAKTAYEMGEIPVGAVVVRGGEIIGRGHNLRENKKSATAHAEVLAIEEACKSIGDWRLTGCTLYVTLEPCIMCTGAIVNARPDRVVIGTQDKKAGGMGGLTDILELSVNHKPIVEFGVLQDECAGILKDFFKALRKGPAYKKPSI